MGILSQIGQLVGITKQNVINKDAVLKDVLKQDAQQGLFNSPDRNPNQYLHYQVYSIGNDPKEIVLPYERREQIILGRQLFATSPTVSAAILNKNQIAIGNAWQPVFAGTVTSDEDKAWVDAATNWLIHDFYPNCNWNGQNFTFADTLFLTGKDIDIDGGSLMLFKTTKSGMPRIQLVTTDRIGSRGNEKIISGGTYDGYEIYDGIIYNNQEMPVAYKILGVTVDDDQIISAFNCQYLFEPQWSTAGHGISRVCFSVTNLMDIRDIKELLKITIKNFSAQGIIHKNPKGAAPQGMTMFQKETITQPPANAVPGETQNKIFYQNINKGGTQFISSLDGSEIEPFSFDRPSPNTLEFLENLASESLVSMGWFYEMVNPSSLNGTATRLVQDQARKLIVWRQQTIERRAKAIVQYGLSVAMQQGLIPKTNNPTWLRWHFNRPGELTIDTGYDAAAMVENLKLGLSTKSEICSRRGKDWKDVSNQSLLELKDIFTRAKELAAEFNISEAEAREWISQRDIDVIAPQVAKGESTPPPEQPPKDKQI